MCFVRPSSPVPFVARRGRAMTSARHTFLSLRFATLDKSANVKVPFVPKRTLDLIFVLFCSFFPRYLCIWRLSSCLGDSGRRILVSPFPLPLLFIARVSLFYFPSTSQCWTG